MRSGVSFWVILFKIIPSVRRPTGNGRLPFKRLSLDLLEQSGLGGAADQR